jgi:hypothetical protein
MTTPTPTPPTTPDPVSLADLEAVLSIEARHSALQVAAFHRELLDRGTPPKDALALTQDYLWRLVPEHE